MSYSDPMKLFSVLKERAQTQSNSSGSFGNPNILKLQRGQSYSLRLLWLPSDVREYPMINQYVHRIWDDNAVGSKDVSVICPTSQYDQDNAGFRSCPICERMSALYKEASDGSASADELYKKFKRTLRGYVPVYVVNGPANDLHKVKILQYTISFKRYFDEKIFGIRPTDNNEGKDGQKKDVADVDENIVGLNAFMYYDPKNDTVVTRGHNFIITVGTKRIPINNKVTEVPDYKLDFSMKETDITDFDGAEITTSYFMNLSKELKFDEDFFKKSNMETLTKFKMKYIDDISDSAYSDMTVDSNLSHTVDEEIEQPAAKTITKKKQVVEELDEEPEPPKKTAKKQIVEEPEETEESADSGSKNDDDIDLDALLADIN